ncbi:hypothetical protein F5Y08DRAFT_86664 [Xylaria arbuscula]|nr:hypothetical protein F5Y08DRAFT_86664 [Xylaria arbuscula]
MWKASFILGLLMLGVTALKSPGDLTVWALNVTSVIDDADTRDLLADTSKTPTQTRSVTFKPFEQSWGSLTDSSVLRDSEWTWRINVTEFASAETDPMNNVTSQIGGIEATYDFTWPVEGNISAALDGSNSPLCITALDGLVDLPVNITNAYKEDTGSSCVPVLGQECVNAILAGAPEPSLQDCNVTASISWGSIPECQDSFGVSSRVQDGFGTTTVGFNISTNAKYSWESGHPFYWQFYEGAESNETDNTIQKLLDLSNKVHIMMLSTGFDGGKLGPQLLCSRVNITELPDTDPNSDGVTLTGEAVLENRGVKGMRGDSQFGWALWATALLATLTLL